MRIKVHSHRGDHEAVLSEPDARLVFNKLTGGYGDPLPADLKTRVPDTWQELEALWNPGQPQYLAAVKDAKGEATLTKEWRPDVAEMTFLAPVTGG
jgi:hypothetical protein